MHLGLIIDESRLGREQVLVQRLCTGLIESGDEITAIGPEDPEGPFLPEDATGGRALRRIPIGTRVPAWLRRSEARRLASMVENDAPELLYAMGDRSWRIGLDVARELQCPLMVDVWSAEQIARVPLSGGDAHVAGYICATEPIAEAVRQRAEPEMVSVVPVGVVAPATARHILADPDESVAVAVIGSGQDVAPYKGLLAGLSRLVREYPQIQVCLELRGPQEHEIWRQASRLDLLGHVSAIVDAAMHRALLTGCDILVSPEHLGQMRSILLQAMANGMPVVASADDYLDMLIPDKTAIVIGSEQPAEWTEALGTLIEDAPAARALGESARQWVAVNHRLSEHVRHLRQVFEQVLSGGAHAFAD